MWRICVLVASFVQGANAQIPATHQGPSTPITTPVTLMMDWGRGDLHYGPDFVWLSQPCQNSDEIGCTCRVRFATRTPEFADYISSFGDRKVPVVYEVAYNPNRQAIAVKFLRAGTWSRDKLTSPNDGLIGVVFGRFKANRRRVSIPSDCFPGLKLPDSAQ